MEGISACERFFPIQDISEVVQLFKYELENTKEPDLALLSIVVGSIENLLTCNRTTVAPNESDVFGNPKLPVIEYKIVDALYKKFQSTIKGYVDMSVFGNIKYATRELVKRVSDVIWNSLTRSYYKDRAHLQSLYSYLTGSKLDCFGVAFAVVAGCQVLGFSDVHLALSEDHAWVIFGEDSTETAEVTWHGNEDKRGQSVDAGVASKCWLYLNGCPVRCNRYMEVAALVSAINPSLNVNSDAIEVALLQQELLWLLYDMGHLSKYPMAIGNLGDLEEINPSPGRPACSSLFQEAILAARLYYKNMHVYPYTYQGGYFYRHNMYKEAFESWANASDVLKQYNYTRDDEEIYKEVMEIANELIPHIMKVVSGLSAKSILKDPECFAHLLRFYDGICQWEEGSQTPVLHIGWAKPLVNTISKFDAQVRGQVTILEQDFISETGDENCNNVNPSKNEERLEKENGKSNFVSDTITSENSKNELDSANLHPGIKELTAACGEKLLNRDFLIQGGGEPFVGDSDVIKVCPPLAGENDNDVFESVVITQTHQPRIILTSEKMRGLKNLLLGEKLNTHAISLQLTAQSQVQVGSKKSMFRESSESGINVRSKRSRRE
ncbi:menin isoform X2 [Planococcus citri]|uniref:menin isoform X2 n=1 Tax=Planococcus citri TaxID=170843 RepID=UPI0031F7AF85